MQIEIIINQNFLCGVIYEHEGKFIAVESRSSMGFQTFNGALQWIAFASQGRLFSPFDDTYKMMPQNVKEEVQRQLLAV